MKIFTRVLGAAFAATGIAFAGAAAAGAPCVTGNGEGTGAAVESAKFQAYEAVLQATDRQAWSRWMAQGRAFGTAPGYQVKILNLACKKGGPGSEGHVEARLCKA